MRRKNFQVILLLTAGIMLALGIGCSSKKDAAPASSSSVVIPTITP